MALDIDPLYVGMTRPTLVWGVTFPAMLLNVMLTFVAFIGSNKITALAVFIPLHSISYLICATEPRQFELLGLWLKTKGKNLNKRFWLASSYSPLEKFRETSEKENKKVKKQ